MVYMLICPLLKTLSKGTVFKIYPAEELKNVTNEDKSLATVAAHWWWENPFLVISVDSTELTSPALYVGRFLE